MTKPTPVRLFTTFGDVYYWTRDSEARKVVNQGGSSSGKTVGTLQRIATLLTMNPGRLATVAAETYSALKRGALRDFKNLIASNRALSDQLMKPDLVRGPYIFKNGSSIEFISVKDPGDAKHGKRDYLFLNEANHLSFEAVTQLMIRTNLQIFIDYNSDAKFWVHNEVLGKEDCDFFISTYLNNPYASPNVIDDLMEIKQKAETSGDPYWVNQYRVYVLGLTGKTEGAIFNNVHYIDQLPLGLENTAYITDWGFSADPTTLAKVGTLSTSFFMGRPVLDIYGKELLYKTGLTTPEYIKYLGLFGIQKNRLVRKGGILYRVKGDLIVADSANPDAIAQVQAAGYNMVASVKGPGSVKSGIQALQSQNIFITKDSENWIEEHKKYRYKKVLGIWTSEPEDKNNHLWDPLRYYYRFLQLKRTKHKEKERDKARKARPRKRKLSRTSFGSL